MNAATAVFEVDPSVEDDRPQIDFERPEHANIDWGPFNEIEAGTAPASVYRPVRFFVDESTATSWDLYLVSGTLGLFSERSIETIGRPVFRLFHLLPAFLNDSSYFILMPRDKLDCFDRTSANVVVFPSNPSRIMQIKRHAFHLNQIADPLIFCIPDIRGRLFATDSVERAVRQSGLKGIHCKQVF